MSRWLKSFNVGILEINAWDDGGIEIDTGCFSQAILDKEQVLELLTILQTIVKGEVGES